MVSVTKMNHPSGASRKDGIFPVGHMLPFSLVTSLFFMWGVPHNLNDILIRQFMKSFALTRFEAGLVQSAFYLGYFLVAIPAALIIRRFSYKVGILVGLALYSTGTFLFWPAAIEGKYFYFLGALFVIASGLSFLETASNPFIAELGDPRSSERRLNFSQAFNPLGSISGVLIGTVFIFSGVELSPAQISGLKAQNLYEAYLRSETLRVVRPYMALGIVAFVLGLIILRTKFPAIESEHEGETGDHGHFRDLLGQPHFLFAVIAQFLYVGAQVGTWSYFIQYVEEATHQHEKVAGFFLTGTLVAFAVGRFTSAYLMRFFAPHRMLGTFALINVGLVVIGVMFPGWVGLWAIFLTSFFMSLMFPTIFALGIKGLGPDTKIGGSMIVMAVAGGAVLTPAMGLLSESGHGVALAYLVPLTAYVFVCAYGFFGATWGLKTDEA